MLIYKAKLNTLSEVDTSKKLLNKKRVSEITLNKILTMLYDESSLPIKSINYKALCYLNEN